MAMRDASTVQFLLNLNFAKYCTAVESWKKDDFFLFVSIFEYFLLSTQRSQASANVGWQNFWRYSCCCE
jgi:hypothetical protein